MIGDIAGQGLGAALALASLFDQVQRTKSERHTFAPPKSPKPKLGVGRNDKCPCGSGKKFKRCCQD